MCGKCRCRGDTIVCLRLDKKLRKGLYNEKCSRSREEANEMEQHTSGEHVGNNNAITDKVYES